MYMKYILNIVLLSATIFVGGCSNNNTAPKEKGVDVTEETSSVMKQLWSVSPLSSDISLRTSAYKNIQKWADAISSATFMSFLGGQDWLANSLVKSERILACYNQAFDRVLDGIRNNKPSEGTVHIWHLYNMGYVVQTSKGCFGIDIYHRRGAELAPYLDFICITHKHQDHHWRALTEAMTLLEKPVFSNFLPPSSYVYSSTVNKDYEKGIFKIHTFITDHNNNPTNVPVTGYQIDCGNGFVLLHTGDSNFKAEQFDISKDIDVYIPRYAQSELAENNVIGKVFFPKYVLLSHILELSHKDTSSSRWSLEMGLARTVKLNCDKSCMPFWGDLLVWKNGILK